MAIIHRYLITLAVLLALSSALLAQSTPVDSVSLQFTVFARYRQVGLQYAPSAQGKPETLQFYTQAKSPIYKYRGSPVLSFYEAGVLDAYAAARLIDPKAPPPAPIAQVTVSAAMKHALLLFIPLPQPQADGLKFAVYPVDDSLEKLPAGHVAVINASGQVYMAKIGTQVVEIPRGFGPHVPAEGTVDFSLAYNDSGQWMVAARHMFTIRPQERVCLVLFPPSSKTGIAPIIRTLVDQDAVQMPNGSSRLITQVN
jgi:hypothetical protein